jgi:hypothetical protein
VKGYRTAVDHVKFIIRVERFGTPLTTNHYFNENLQKCKTRRLEKLLGKYAEPSHHISNGPPANKLVRLDQIKQSMTMENAEYTIQDIHDILESYYKVARKRFVDTVCMQGSDFHLLTGTNLTATNLWDCLRERAIRSSVGSHCWRRHSNQAASEEFEK